jgi:uncharacterized protein
VNLPPHSPPNSSMATSHNEALELIRNQRTMVLATCEQAAPWSAPVYFVYTPHGFCFFSSPQSTHIHHIQSGSAAAASIFSDSGQWRDIRGLQMRGNVHKMDKIGDRLELTGRFIFKFPFARDFLQAGPGTVPDLSRRVQLYSFVPHEIFLVDNSTAFGRRQPLDLDLLGPAAQRKE